MAISIFTPVGELRESLLAVLASWIHGNAVGVECMHSSQQAVQIVCQSRTLVVHPERCNLLMLLVAAELLAHRREVRGAVVHVDAEAVRRWIPEARRSLVARFPAFAAIPPSAWNACTRGNLLPAVHWDTAKVAPPQARFLSDAQRRRNGELASTSLDLVLPDCHLEGADDAFAEIVAGIANGSHALQQLPDLPDVPFLVAQVRLGNRVDAPRGLNEVIGRSRHRLDASRAFAHCIRTSTEGLPLDNPPDTNALYGRDLDLNRLADARIATRLGRDFPVFAREEDPVSTFDPRQHRAVVYSDVTEHEADLRDMAPSLAGNAAVAHAYELLGIATEWHACRDFLVPGPSGKPVVLHLAFVLKRIDEPWAPIVWERLRRVHTFRPSLEATPAVFPALHMRRTVELLGRVADDVGTEGWWHPALLMSPNMEAMQHVSRGAERFVAHMERDLERAQEKRQLKSLFWLPNALRKCIRRGSLLRDGLIGKN